MARTVYSNKLKNRTNRLALAARPKPYTVAVAPNVALAYRRTEGAGSWSVKTPQFLKRFALADDHEPANGSSVLDFYQASQKALALVRGGEGTDKPITVLEAVDLWAADLASRGGGKANATTLKTNLEGAVIAGKPVQLLTAHDLSAWRDSLWTRTTPKPVKLSSANRVGKSLAAALSLAAARNPQIANSHAWKVGLKAKRVKGETSTPRDDFYLPDQSVNAIVSQAYATDPELAPLLHVLAVVGGRESQALKIHAGDIIDTDSNGNAALPSLMVWQSEKGRADREPQQYSVAITASLHATLKRLALIRGPKQPLLTKEWNVSVRFRAILKALGLNEELSPYVLRHSSIIRGIFSGKATYLVAAGHDTSEQQISQTYARFLEQAKKNSDQTRLGLLADDIIPTNVVAMVNAA